MVHNALKMKVSEDCRGLKIEIGREVKERQWERSAEERGPGSEEMLTDSKEKLKTWVEIQA